MSYIINTNTFADNFLPPKKRVSKFIAFTRVLLYPLQVLFDTIFGTFKDGNNASDWDVSSTYAIGDQVKYKDGSIYQCYVATTAGIVPTNTSYWFLIQGTFVGLEPRLKYNSERIVFEWLLNEKFGTTFVNSPGASDIYIENIDTSDSMLWVGINEAESGLIVADNADIDGWVQAVDLPLEIIYFNIYVPIAVANALTTEPNDSVPNISENRANIIRGVADLYVLAGIRYEIITY
jgi:hypothetical protein